jgi:hypothetical protein
LEVEEKIKTNQQSTSLITLINCYLEVTQLDSENYQSLARGVGAAPHAVASPPKPLWVLFKFLYDNDYHYCD